MFSKVLKAALCGITAIAAGVALTSCENIKKANLIDLNLSFQDNSFSKINANIYWGKLKIISSDDDSISIYAQNVPDTFKSEIKNGVLIIDFNTKNGVIAPRNAKTSITIKVPEKDYKKLYLKLGTGNTTIKDLKISNIDVEYGTGKLNMNNVKADKLINIEGVKGTINISNSILGSVNADLGIGRVDFEGTVNGDIDIECGIGDVNINLTNPESDFKSSESKYKLKINKGIGNLNISYNNWLF